MSSSSQRSPQLPHLGVVDKLGSQFPQIPTKRKRFTAETWSAYNIAPAGNATANNVRGRGTAVSLVNGDIFCAWSDSTNAEIFVYRLDKNGRLKWRTEITGHGVATTGIYCGLDGEVRVATTGTTAGYDGGYVHLRNDNGNHRARVRYSNPSNGATQMITGDFNGDTYTAGRYFNGNWYQIYCKHNSAGTVQWQMRNTSTTDEAPGTILTHDGTKLIQTVEGGGDLIFWEVQKSDGDETGTNVYDTGLPGPLINHLDVDSEGNIYCITNTDRIVRCDSGIDDLNYVRLSETDEDPRSICTDDDGNVWALCQYNEGNEMWLKLVRLDSDMLSEPNDNDDVWVVGPLFGGQELIVEEAINFNRVTKKLVISDFHASLHVIDRPIVGQSTDHYTSGPNTAKVDLGTAAQTSPTVTENTNNGFIDYSSIFTVATASYTITGDTDVKILYEDEHHLVQEVGGQVISVVAGTKFTAPDQT